MSQTGPAATGYGGFSRGVMNLALPLVALREVVPCLQLLPLPCPAAAILGGIDLRGVVVPVLDLCRLLGQPQPPAAASPVVIIMTHAGRLLGLLADGVRGIFQADAAGLARMHAADPVAAVLAGSIRRADGGGLVSVLCPEALCRLDNFPWVDDPQPAGTDPPDGPAGPDHPHGDADASADPAVAADASVTMLLARSGRALLAIDAMSVHATLSAPTLEPSVLARGHCVGVLEHAGARLPAVDLASFCGQPPLPPGAPRQAIVLHLDSGLVACLVGEVMDVVRTDRTDVIAVPSFALTRHQLYAGALPVERLSAELRSRLQLQVGQFLVLNGAALRADEDLIGLAGFSGARAVQADTTAGAPGRGRAMITFALDGETATPIEQVTEILAFVPELMNPASDSPVLGLMINRGRSIPVACLSSLSGLDRPAPSPTTSVLVVDTGGVLTGFAVPALKSIEPADWEPELPTHGGGPTDELGQSLAARTLALIGTGEGQRMLRVLDLQRVARALQTRPLAA